MVLKVKQVKITKIIETFIYKVFISFVYFLLKNIFGSWQNYFCIIAGQHHIQQKGGKIKMPAKKRVAKKKVAKKVVKKKTVKKKTVKKKKR